jgi:cytochrome o ubiquinol oxidase operon protein cyoD
MSDHTHAHHGHDDHEHHGSIKDYTIGFVLSVILTAIPFWLVMGGPLENSQTVTAIIVAFAAVQVIVHMVYFLHMNGKAEGGWTMLSTLFTVVVLVIMLAGSIWVMYHMNTNMMPQMDHSVTAPAQAPTSTITPEQAAPVQAPSHGGH